MKLSRGADSATRSSRPSGASSAYLGGRREMPTYGDCIQIQCRQGPTAMYMHTHAHAYTCTHNMCSICMYVCIYVRMPVWMDACVCMEVYVYVQHSTCICTCIRVHVYIYIHNILLTYIYDTYILYIYVYIYIYIRVCVCVPVCVRACVGVYTFICVDVPAMCNSARVSSSLYMYTSMHMYTCTHMHMDMAVSRNRVPLGKNLLLPTLEMRGLLHTLGGDKPQKKTTGGGESRGLSRQAPACSKPLVLTRSYVNPYICIYIYTSLFIRISMCMHTRV